MNSEAIPTPFCAYKSRVEKDWLDYNGHMNVAYYTRAFDEATDLWWTYLGLGPEYVKAEGRSVFAVEAHVVYKRELQLGAPLHVTTRLLGFDEKRMHVFLELHHSEKNYLSATEELMVVHVDMKKRAAVPFPDAVLGRLEAALAAHSQLPVPEQVGRQIAVKPRRQG